MQGNQCLGGYYGNEKKPTCLCQKRERLKRKGKKLKKMMYTKIQGQMTRRLLVPRQKGKFKEKRV